MAASILVVAATIRWTADFERSNTAVSSRRVRLVRNAVHVIRIRRCREQDHGRRRFGSAALHASR